MSTWRSTKAPPEALRAKSPCKLETTSQGSQGAKLAANGAKLAVKRRRRQAILDTDPRNFYLQITALIFEILQPLVVQFLAVSHVSFFCRRWVLSDVAMRLVSSSPFSALRSLTIFCCRVRGAYWECRWRRAASLRRGRVGKPPQLPLAPLTSARPRSRVAEHTFLIHIVHIFLYIF